MGSRAWEDAQEARAEQLLAKALGLTAAEAEAVGATAEEDTGSSGEGAYGYSVSFRRDADPSIMAKVIGLGSDGLVHLGPNDLEQDDEPL